MQDGNVVVNASQLVPAAMQLGKVVADNVLTFDQSFWMRLALRHDQATTEEQKTQCARSLQLSDVRTAHRICSCPNSAVHNGD